MPAISIKLPRRISEGEYLQTERNSEQKSEYVEGSVFAMSGARDAHDRLQTNLVSLIWTALRGRTCRVFGSDMKVRSELASSYYYPDASALCGEPRFLDATRDVLTNPSVIFEILSASTERIDRHEKFAAYRLIPSLVNYVLISQFEYRVEVFTKADEGWEGEVFDRLDQSFGLSSIEVEIGLHDLYEGVDLTSRD